MLQKIFYTIVYFKNWVGVTDGQDGSRVKLADGVFR